jgi:uncharacterized integral membrane protein
MAEDRPEGQEPTPDRLSGSEPLSPAPAEEEGRLQRGLRATHPARLYATLLLALLAAIYLILLIVQNTRRVPLDYVFGTANARLIWLILVSALTGWLLGLATSFLVRRRTRRQR